MPKLSAFSPFESQSAAKCWCRLCQGSQGEAPAKEATMLEILRGAVTVVRNSEQQSKS